MPFKQHDRQYDLVVFGATGYTGKLTVEYISAYLPTNLRWALAGRSYDKLQQVVEQCKYLNQDRAPPAIEVCLLNGDDLSTLAQKTFILITTVGPYGRYGEHAFKACAESGTHYLDVTGEVPFVARMIKKYEAVAKTTGAIMFPQNGIESAPSDLLTWSAAQVMREKFHASTKDVTISIHKLIGKPSGGTFATVWTLFDNFTLSELRAAHVPYALSPIPRSDEGRPSSRPTASKATGVVRYPKLGLMTTSLAGKTDAAIVERTWGLLRATPSTQSQFYGPNFSFRQYYRVPNWFIGLRTHWSLILFGLVLTIRPLRKLVSRFTYQAGEGQTAEESKEDELEMWATADADIDGDVRERVFCRSWWKGPLYYLTGLLVAEAAMVILEDDHRLQGGIYTPACLGQPYIDRLDKAGFHFESKTIPV